MTGERDNHIRIGDREREETVRLLQEHTSAGRLTLTEFDERAARAYAAKTRGDLAELTTDLPAPARVPSPAPVPVPQAHPMTGLSVVRVLVPAVLLMAVFGLAAGGAPVAVGPFIAMLICFSIISRHRGRGCSRP